ncbi:hypothetical protein [Embleya sp. NBC_00896]|uniref:hypothetical protein n=1 Tax=Embleya sp. NBC_00896 TaxID=2975961 RepID=UPI0038679DE1|nr:hypothetical protein OG928_32455 [Embleya sp. NBC_00896]
MPRLRLLQVPALSLTVVERVRENFASLLGVHVEPLDPPAAPAAGDLVRAGFDWRISHAVHLARPTLDYPGGGRCAHSSLSWHRHQPHHARRHLIPNGPRLPRAGR